MKKQEPSSLSESFSWTDLAKKVVLTGLGSASFARDVVKDSKLHRDVYQAILSKAEKRKDEFLEILAKEVSKFLGKINVSDEIVKALSGLVIRLNATVDFDEKKGKGTSPTTRIHKVKVSRKER